MLIDHCKRDGLSVFQGPTVDIALAIARAFLSYCEHVQNITGLKIEKIGKYSDVARQPAAAPCAFCNCFSNNSRVGGVKAYCLELTSKSFQNMSLVRSKFGGYSKQFSYVHGNKIDEKIRCQMRICEPFAPQMARTLLTMALAWKFLS